MKKISRMPDYNLGPVRLNLDDLNSIVEAIQQLPDPQPEIRIGEYQVDSLDEAQQIRQKSHRYMSIFSRGIGVSVLISPTTASVRGGYDLDRRGVAAEIADILRPRQRWWRWLQPVHAGILAGVLVGLALINLSPAPLGAPRLPVEFTWAAFAAAALVGIIYQSLLPYRQTRIELVHADATTTFWSRNKDKIWLALITSVLSVVVTLLAQALLS